MPKAKREKNCYVCEESDMIRLSFMICARCSKHFCSRHGEQKMDECHPCIDDGEET